MPEDFYTISELNRFIKDVINAGFPQTIWVCGELQQYDRNKTKRHVFFELVEKDELSEDIVARIGLVIFANKKSYIESVLRKSENAFELKDDIEVKFECKVDFYAPHGAVRLIVENIDPFYTLGKLAAEKQKLIALLKKKGVLDKNKQLELPEVPLRLGLITSYDSAAYNDFLSELKKSGLGFEVFFENALVQGKNAPKDICRALNVLNKMKNLDAIVLTRGGGSISDLSCFDSQEIAEKIAVSRYPILTGIGHEIDLSIADMAAHTFSKTPTAIAQFFVNRIDNFLERLDTVFDDLVHLANDEIEKAKSDLTSHASILQNITLLFLKEHNEQLIKFSEVLKMKPLICLKELRRNLIRSSEDLKRNVDARINSENEKLKNYQKLIEVLHPVNTLKRGFSITRSKDGKTIKNSSSLKKGDLIETQFADGIIDSEVIGK